MLDNIDVAILTKLNCLAERYGLKPYDFVASLEPRFKNGKADGTILTFEVFPLEPLNQNRFQELLDALGVDKSGQLSGNDSKIVDALDTALSLAPNSRSRV